MHYTLLTTLAWGRASGGLWILADVNVPVHKSLTSPDVVRFALGLEYTRVPRVFAHIGTCAVL